MAALCLMIILIQYIRFVGTIKEIVKFRSSIVSRCNKHESLSAYLFTKFVKYRGCANLDNRFLVDLA